MSLGMYVYSCSPKSEDSCGFVQNVYGERISWKGNVPVKLAVHESVPFEYREAIAAAADKWNQVSGRQLLVIDSVVGGPPEARKDGANVIYMNPTWEADKGSEQGRTSIYWTGNQIRETDIRLNGANFNYYWQNVPATGGVNIEALVLHEMGHVLGLKHKDEGGSVMQTYLASNSDRTQISEADAKALKCEY